jgi:hypothetical protein
MKFIEKQASSVIVGAGTLSTIQIITKIVRLLNIIYSIDIILRGLTKAFQ